MITRLPAWVWSVAAVLAAIAGMINVIALLGFDHQAVTHMTGSMSLLSEALVARSANRASHIAAIVGAFVVGTILSGVLIQDSVLRLGRRYGIALLLESALLLVALVLLNRRQLAGMYAAACACGLQNAMMTTYSGTIVRTTHVSGMVTDLGISLGHWLRGMTVDRRRVQLCLAVISGFLVGGCVGAYLFSVVGFDALLPPILFTGLAGIAYSISRKTAAGASA